MKGYWRFPLSVRSKLVGPGARFSEMRELSHGGCWWMEALFHLVTTRQEVVRAADCRKSRILL